MLFVLECWLCMYMLNSVVDGTLPCGTPVLTWCCDDILFLNVVYTLRS